MRRRVRASHLAWAVARPRAPTRFYALALMVFLSSGVSAQEGYPRYLYLLPQGFSGWVCVDFGVEGAPPLPREGDARIIRARPGVTIETSDTADIPPFGEVQFEVGGQRISAPEDFYQRRMSSRTDTNDPVAHHCAFYGTEDAADSADAEGASGMEDDWGPPATGVSWEERRALIDLYQATNGDAWTHRVGWLGPPGTECSWHGVQCHPRFADTTSVMSLDLLDDGLVGTVPETLGALKELESLTLWGNRLSGKLPAATLERWLAGPLEISGEASLFTDVTAIEFEWQATGLLCAWHGVALRADGSADAWARRCRNATPDERTTFCEVKKGRVWPTDFGRLGHLLESHGFFDLPSGFDRSVTHAVDQTTRVTRGGLVHVVDDYAGAGPNELWMMERAIEGVAADIDWDSVSTQPTCVGGQVED